MSTSRKSAISAERASILGAHAAETENQIEQAQRALRGLDVPPIVARSLAEARQRLEIIRLACYWEPSADDREQTVTARCRCPSCVDRLVANIIHGVNNSEGMHD